ncbi:hypothetical protein ICL07_24370 [Chitinophaga qingshengii]|uniref:RHS repeat protein n=2 Tax=Chitinophaga qingshengii TaxID=1569794 RepID=A0ABR7TSU4_9BACT|nr:hypothetical protein [Chitinophaga qingshengii]
MSVDACCILAGGPQVQFQTPSTQYTYYRKLIDSIQFTNGSIKFVYQQDRIDPLSDRLASIRISNTAGLIKEVELIQSYFDTSENQPADYKKYARRLKLDKIKFKGNDSHTVNAYGFGYENGILPPYKEYKGYEVSNFAQDYWGYYNGNSAATSLLPNTYRDRIAMFLWKRFSNISQSVLDQYSSRSFSRSVNPSAAKACMLNRIVYPTGGYTQFDFESNSTSYTNDEQSLVGGQRIARITTFDSLGRNVQMKNYSYDKGSLISPNIATDFCYETTKLHKTHCIGYCVSSVLFIAQNPVSPINTFNGVPIFYGKVIEYEGYPGLGSGKTEYEFEFEDDSGYGSGVLDKYRAFTTDKSWARGQLIRKKIYKKADNGFSLIKSIKNSYTKIKEGAFKVGQICEVSTIAPNLMTFLALEAPATTVMTDHFEYGDVYMVTGAKMLTQSVETDYANDSLEIVKNIFYDNPLHLYPTRIQTYTRAKQDSSEKIIRYAQDAAQISNLTPSATAAINGMILNNMLEVPIEQTVINKTTVANKSRVDFKKWGDNRFYEEIGYEQVGNSTLKPRIRYNSYDEKGNPTAAQMIDNINGVNIWGYNQSLILATVKNANVDEVAFTSFESDADGNWSISASNRNTSGFLTGKASYSLRDGAITKNGLQQTSGYFVSYWSAGGSALVNNNTGTAITTQNGWTLFRHKVINSTNVTVSGNVTIDELRLHPEGAQMTSYTHTPLVGATSIADAKNMITYYEYDQFSRLTTIRDAKRMVLKQLSYSYADTIVNPGNSQWVYDGQPILVGTGNTRCEKDNDSLYTGKVQSEAVDTNPKSPSYQMRMWSKGYPSDTCPMDPKYCIGEDNKYINGKCEAAHYVTTNIEIYYDANGKKMQAVTYHKAWSDGSRGPDLVKHEAAAEES